MKYAAIGVGVVAVCAGSASAQCSATEFVELQAEEPMPFGHFGESVDVKGTTAVIGHAGAAKITGDEAAYVFELSPDGTSWVQIARLTASDGVTVDLGFGADVAISTDRIFVGAPGAIGGCPGDPTCPGGGVYVFQKPVEGWMDATETWKVTASDTTGTDAVGEAVEADGDTFVVGNLLDDFAGSNSGAAYVFHFDGTRWNQEAQLIGLDSNANDFFGDEVGISADTIVVGAREHSHGASGTGGAYVFQRDQGGPDAWGQLIELVPSDLTDNDALGDSIDIDGDRTVVGSNAASAYIFERDFGGADNWGEVVKLTASDPGGQDGFGESAAVRGDLVAIGAFLDNEPDDDEGSVYVFMRDFGGHAAWGEAAKLTASNGMVNDKLGVSVALGDGVLASGAHTDAAVGSVYAYHGVGDCNGNNQLDLCEIASGEAADDNGNGFPDGCECPWDLDGSGGVGTPDFLDLLAQWGSDPGGPPDFDGDGTVGTTDFLELLANWGSCP